MAIHPTAFVDPSAVLADSVEVGPYAIVGAKVTLGAGTTVGAHAIVEGPSLFGEDNRIHPHAALGGPPQDLKYKGEPTELIVGSRNVFREFMTAHRGTIGGHRKTVIGDDNFFMAYAHVAHDCVVGNRTVFANGASLAGHCTVEDDVILGGYALVKQFLTVGRHAYVGGFTPVNRNVLPFVWTSSERETKAWKVNAVGLSRKGFSPESVAALQKAYRALHRHRHDKASMLSALDEIAASSADVKYLTDFIRAAKEGVHGA
jgi:UDP-N-acetylglucosamine acyltransferase